MVENLDFFIEKLNLFVINEKEVFFNIIQYIGNMIEDFLDLLFFYNIDVEFIFSFYISKSGKIEQIILFDFCKSLIVVVLVKEFEELGKVFFVFKDGVVIERQFCILV